MDLAKFRVPLNFDPNSSMFLAIASPDGGIGNFPALVKGDDGDTPDISSNINLTMLENTDTNPESASWTETSPDTYTLNLTLKKAPKGDDGDTVLTPSDYVQSGSSVLGGQLLRVTADGTGFELFSSKIGKRFLPATMNNVPTGNPSYTVCAIACDAQTFDWYPIVEGQIIVTGTSSDVAVNYLARLSTAGVVNGETAGPIVGVGQGIAGLNPPALVMSSTPPAGAGPTYDKVLAGNTAVVYFRTERQVGSGSYSTLASQSFAKVTVQAIP